MHGVSVVYTKTVYNIQNKDYIDQTLSEWPVALYISISESLGQIYISRRTEFM